ncbi:MAG: RidA family protein [Pseudomonadota bacterium]
MPFQPLFPQELPAPFGRYAHGVAIPGGQKLVRTSGQLAVDADGNTPISAFEQASLIFSNIDSILREGGLDCEAVCHIAGFVTKREHMAEYMRARDIWLERVESLPASTLVIVSGFTRPEFLVEIEVTAVG